MTYPLNKRSMTQIALRLPTPIIEQADRIAKHRDSGHGYDQGGRRAIRSEVLRDALHKGIILLASELPKPKPKTKKKKR